MSTGERAEPLTDAVLFAMEATNEIVAASTGLPEEARKRVAETVFEVVARLEGLLPEHLAEETRQTREAVEPGPAMDVVTEAAEAVPSSTAMHEATEHTTEISDEIVAPTTAEQATPEQATADAASALLDELLRKGFHPFARADANSTPALSTKDQRILRELQAHPGKIVDAQTLAHLLVVRGSISLAAARGLADKALQNIGARSAEDIGGTLLYKDAAGKKTSQRCIVFVPSEMAETPTAESTAPPDAVETEMPQVAVAQELPTPDREPATLQPKTEVDAEEPEAPPAADEMPPASFEHTLKSSVDSLNPTESPEEPGEQPYKLFDVHQITELDDDVDVMSIPRFPKRHAILLTRRGLSVVASSRGRYELNLRGQPLLLGATEQTIIRILLQNAMQQKRPMNARQLREELLEIVGREEQPNFDGALRNVLNRLGDNDRGIAKNFDFAARGVERTTYAAKGVLCAFPSDDVLKRFLADAAESVA